MRLLGCYCLLLLLLVGDEAEAGQQDEQGEQKHEAQEEEVIVVHDSWEDATDETQGEYEDPGESSPKMEVFTAADAVTSSSGSETSVPPPMPPPGNEAEETPVEDPAVASRRTLFEEGLAKITSSTGDKRAGWDLIQQASEAGHKPATNKLAWALMFGSELSQDIEQSHQLFSKLASEGDPEGQMGMAFLFATGTLVNSSQSQALLHYTFGAFGGSSWAQMALGYRYWSGMGVATSCEKALDYYRRVAQVQHRGTKVCMVVKCYYFQAVAAEVSFSGGQTLQRVRLQVNENLPHLKLWPMLKCLQDELDNGGQSGGLLDNDLIEYYQLLADKGDVQAQVKLLIYSHPCQLLTLQVGLGQLHYQGGRGVAMDQHNALNYFQQAADAGNAVAMAFLGKMYLEGGEAVAQNNETALKYFKKAASLGNPVGQSGLGLMHLYGKGVPKDYKKALDFFQKAAEQSWVDGQLHLGNMYYNGWGVRKDFKMAIKYFNLASQSGHVLAFHNLADMHATGTGMLRFSRSSIFLPYMRVLFQVLSNGGGAV